MNFFYIDILSSTITSNLDSMPFFAHNQEIVANSIDAAILLHEHWKLMILQLKPPKLQCISTQFNAQYSQYLIIELLNYLIYFFHQYDIVMRSSSTIMMAFVAIHLIGILSHIGNSLCILETISSISSSHWSTQIEHIAAPSYIKIVVTETKNVMEWFWQITKSKTKEIRQS